MNPQDLEKSYNPYQAPQVQDFEDEDNNLLKEPNKVSMGTAVSWVGQSWQIFKARPLLWLASLFIYFILATVAVLLPGAGQFLSGALSVFLMAGFMYLAYGIDIEEEVSVGDLFIGFRHNAQGLLRVWGLSVLISILFALPMIIYVLNGILNNDMIQTQDFSVGFLLTALVALVGTVFMMMAMVFAPLLVLFHELPAIDAMKLSFKACNRNILPLLVFGFVMMVLGILAMIPFGLGIFVVMPMCFISIYVMYKDILVG